MNQDSHQMGALERNLSTVLDRIRSRMSSLTPRQRVVAEYLLLQPERLAFMSIVDLAEQSGVSQATVVRFCTALGYDGYAQMAGEARHAIQTDFGMVDRFQIGRLLDGQARVEDDGSLFAKIVASEIENLVSLTANIRASHFHACVDRILAADRVVIIGTMASEALAVHMENMLSKILPDVRRICGQDVQASASLRRLGPDSLAFLISFPRYPRSSLELARAAAERGAYMVALTNSHMAPAVQVADMCFYAGVNVPSFVDAYAAPVAFIDALATEAGLRNPDAAQEALDRYDRYVAGQDLFLKKGGEWRPRFDPAKGVRKPGRPAKDGKEE